MSEILCHGAGGGAEIVFHPGSSVRQMGIIIGKLGEKEIREQRSENEGVTGGGRIYFGRGGLT